MPDDDSTPPGIHLLQRGDALLVLLAPGVELDQDEWDRGDGSYFSGVTVHFVHGVIGAALHHD